MYEICCSFNFTQMRHAIAPKTQPPSTSNMRQLKKENTIKEFKTQKYSKQQFTPLVFSTTGSTGKEGTTFYKRLADMLSRKQEKPYSVVMGWMRCRLSFAILRSAIMCIRGTRSAFGKPINEESLTLAAADSQTPTEEL